VRGTFRFLLALVAVPVIAQAQPATLKSRLDTPARQVSGFDGSDSTWSFAPMAPGWHVTTGPGVLLYDPLRMATGQYSVDTFVHLFPNPSAAGHGLFLGGQGIDGDSPSYWLFEIRRDGAYRIAQRSARNERVVRDWTPEASIIKHPGGDTTVANRIRVQVRPDSLVLILNTKVVGAVPNTGLPAGGVFGLRIGRGTNVHVTHLDYIQHLAPIRP
jgi:hypothetical protein